jgi:hypothetical protein
MSNPNHFDLELKELAYNSTDKYIMRAVFDQKAFERLYEYLEKKADQLKSESTISKQIVGTILKTANLLESQIKEKELAKKFKDLLELMAISESPGDREPGAPRII